MRFLVKKETELGQNVPVGWPCIANPCADDAEVPRGWEKMTKQQIERIKQSLREDYEAIQRAKKIQQEKEKEREKQAKRDIQLRTRNRLLQMGFQEDEIKTIMQGEYPN